MRPRPVIPLLLTLQLGVPAMVLLGTQIAHSWMWVPPWVAGSLGLALMAGRLAQRCWGAPPKA